MYTSIACIGYGNMGSAFLKGIHKGYPTIRLGVMEKDTSKATLALQECQASNYTSMETLLKNHEAIILAIKPQDALSVLKEISRIHPKPDILSILGGKTTRWIGEQSETGQVARFMPSLSASVRSGAIALSMHSGANETIVENARLIGGSIGTIHEIPENLMSAFTGLSGSGIAFAWSFIHGLAMGGVKNGISYEKSIAIVCDMLQGAATTIREQGDHPISLVSKVCSPGGTTIEGMDVLEQNGFQGLCMEAVTRVTKRSKEFE